MLGFILSKLNLMILVISMFAIVAFFASGLGDIAKVNEANLLLNHITNTTQTIANSNSSCDTDNYPLPEYLKTGGGNFYYVLLVSRVKIKNPDDSLSNNVIFSIVPRNKQDYVFAANSFITNAEVRIYSPDYVAKNYPSFGAETYVQRCTGEELCKAYVDPASRVKMDSIALIKEKLGEKEVLHIIPCPAERCDDLVESIGKVIRPEGGFFCGTSPGVAE